MVVAGSGLTMALLTCAVKALPMETDSR